MIVILAICGTFPFTETVPFSLDKNPLKGVENMHRKTMLGVTAWGFTIAAIVLAIFAKITHHGAMACTFATVAALIFQSVYGKTVKRAERSLPHTPRRARHNSSRKRSRSEYSKSQSNDIWKRRFYGK